LRIVASRAIAPKGIGLKIREVEVGLHTTKVLKGF